MKACQVSSRGLIMSLTLCVGTSANSFNYTVGRTQESQPREQMGDTYANAHEILYDSARELPNSAGTSRTVVIVIEKRHRNYETVYSILRSIAHQRSGDKNLFIYAFLNRTDAEKEIGTRIRMPVCRITRDQVWGPDEEVPPSRLFAKDSGRVATYVRAVGSEEEEVFFFWPQGQVKSNKVVIKQKAVRDYTGQSDADLVIAAFRGDVDRIETMMAAEVAPNLSNADGETALVTAVRRGNTAAAQALLTHGADPNLAAKRGPTPLAAAIASLNEKMIALLLANGANPNTHNADDPPPLDLASAKATSKIVKELLSAGANVNATDPDGGTALMTACERLSLPIVRELLSAGADPNIALVRDGRTALMFCFFRTDMLSALIAAGANVNVHAKDGTTPLMLASEQGFPEAVRVLIKAGANVNAHNNKGQSVLAVAMKDGDKDTQRQLREAGAMP